MYIIPCSRFEDKICAPYTHSELDKILHELPKNKSSGCDKIPNELLQNSGSKFRQYLILFLNKVLEEGVVPSSMNRGKCVLVHKVSVVFKNVKFFLEARDFLNFPFSAQKCFLFLGIPKPYNILNFGQ